MLFGWPSAGSTTHTSSCFRDTLTCSVVVCLNKRSARGNPCTICITMNAPRNARLNKITSFLVDILSNSDESDSKPIAHGALAWPLLKNLWDSSGGLCCFLNRLFLLTPFIKVCHQQMSRQFFLCVISSEMNWQIPGCEEKVADIAERISFMLF
jgi:hypothetical protein